MEPDNPIYIVVEDHDYEGSDVIGAFFFLDKAREYAVSKRVPEHKTYRFWPKIRIEKWLDTEQLDRDVAF